MILINTKGSFQFVHNLIVWYSSACFIIVNDLWLFVYSLFKKMQHINNDAALFL